MKFIRPVKKEAFQAVQNVDIDVLSKLSEADIRPILPCLVRMSLCAPLDTSKEWTGKRKYILRCLSGLEVVNTLVNLLSVDFQALEQAVKSEQTLRAKAGGGYVENAFIAQLEHGVVLEFERSDPARKLRLLLSEVISVIAQVKEGGDFSSKVSELFQNEVYLEEVSDVLCVAQSELPSLLPMCDVAEAMLHIPNGAWLLSRLVANMPDTFIEVCSSLVVNGEKQDEDGVNGQPRRLALSTLCQMNPSHALTVRMLCVEHCHLPGLTVELTLNLHQATEVQPDISDAVSFISGLLLGSDQNIRSWFAQFVKSGQRKPDPTKSTLHLLRLHLQEQLASLIPGDSGVLTEDKVVPASAIIRLYCALKGIAGLQFNETESSLLLQLITSKPAASVAGVRFITLALCKLLACPGLLWGYDQERCVVSWIQWLLAEATTFDRATGGQSSYSEMLLLVAIHFHSNQTSAIADLVCSTLGMKSAVKSNALVRMKAIFTQEIFTEQVVTGHAVQVAVTPQLNAGLHGYLPVHCIHQLLKSRAFTKHRVPIKDWIYNQICSSTSPIHPLMPSLIEAYINSIMLPSTKTDYTNEPITETQILAAFKDSIFPQHKPSRNRLISDVAMEIDEEVIEQRSKFTAQLLLLYYIMLYQDTLLSNMKTIMAANRKFVTYSQQLLSQLPIKYLLQQAQQDQHMYAGLVAPLIRLLATHYPHLCLVEDWLEEDVGAGAPSVVMKVMCTSAQVENAFANALKCPPQLKATLESLLTLPAEQLLSCADVFINNLGKLLNKGVLRRILDLSKKIWIKLNILMPRRLRVMTVNALRPQEDGELKNNHGYTAEDITTDPLIVLRCDHRVFRCPVLLEITLRNLQAYLQASRNQLTEHITTNIVSDKPGQTVNVGEREELKNALVAAQESAAIQILLESCLPEPQEEGESSLLTPLREVQGIVCSCIHQMFIAEPSLAKLVHFQGYPSDLLPVTVAGIPSMHICLDFIPEMISQPQLDKQIFAIQLISYLSVQYALPKALSVARLAVNVMSTLLSVLSSDIRIEFYMQTLSALPRICKAFPPLCDDIITFLLQLGRVCDSHLTCMGQGSNESSDVSVSDPLKSGSDSNNMDKTIQSLNQHATLSKKVQQMFSEITSSVVLLKATR